MSEIPDAISISSLNQIYSSTGSRRMDFSAPNLDKSSIADLAFLFHLYVSHRLGGQIHSHHQVFLADMLVTTLRKSYKEQLDQLGSGSIDSASDVRSVCEIAKIVSHLSVCEGILDGLVRTYMKGMGTSSTKPSFRLARSVDEEVTAHRLDEWITEVSQNQNK